MRSGSMGGIWEASGRHLGLQEAMGLQKRLSCQVAVWESLGLRNHLGQEFGCRGKHLGEASGRHLGSIWVASGHLESGKHLGSIWDASLGIWDLGGICEASGKHQGGIWEASGKHLGCIQASRIWEASGKHLGSISGHLGYGKHLGSIWEASGRHLGGIWDSRRPWGFRRLLEAIIAIPPS